MADILVVEDNADIANAFALMLECDGYDVRIAADGPAALREAARAKPDVVVLDIGLPILDGLEVARRLWKMHGSGVMLVACTGYADDITLGELAQIGFARTLRKPVAIGDLLDAVHALTAHT